MTDNVLIGRLFDVEAFAKMPKCKGSFQKGEAGCLLTGLLKGLDIVMVEGCFIDSNTGKGLTGLFNSIDELAAFHNVDFPRTVACNNMDAPYPYIANIDYFFQYIIKEYDNGDPISALNKIWELIDKLPKKINNTPAAGDYKQVVESQICGLVNKQYAK